MAHFGEQHEAVYHILRARKLGVLAHLRLYSPMPWNTLCVWLRIDQDAETILEELRHQNYIQVDTDKIVVITVSGRRYLQEQFEQKGDM